MPDRIRTFINGTAVIDATFRIGEPDVPPATVMTAAEEVRAAGTPPTLDEPIHIRMETPRASISEGAMPVIVHLQPDADGKVTEAEICTAADPALAPAALEQAKRFPFGRSKVQRQVYMEIRFVPSSALRSTMETRASVPQVKIEPFYVEQTHTDLNTTKRTGSEIFARRSDGATVRVSKHIENDFVAPVREVEFPDGRSVTIYESINAKTSWPPKPANQRLAGRESAPSDCYASGGGSRKLVRKDQVEGVEVAVIEDTTGSMRITTWSAPKLGCQVLRLQTDVMQSTGSFRHEFETRTGKLEIGEPDARLFDIATSLSEMKPSVAIKRMIEPLLEQMSTGDKTAMLRELEREGAEADKRYQAK